jgi:hypothetical protein
MDHEGYYAQAFYVEPGQCFRMVISPKPGSQGSPIHCPDPVEFQGRFQDGTGKWHEVWACKEHAADLPFWKRVSASITDISSAPKSPLRKGGPASI